MRKDPLDPIDGGTKVKIALRRLLNPEAVKVGCAGCLERGSNLCIEPPTSELCGPWVGCIQLPFAACSTPSRPGCEEAAAFAKRSA